MITFKHIAAALLLGGFAYNSFACGGNPACKPAAGPQPQPQSHRTIIDGALREALAMRLDGETKTRGERINALVYSKIMPVVKAADPQKASPAKLYSRCPSGYRSVLAAGESTKTESSADYNLAFGKIIYREGCSAGVEVCEYKIDLTTSTVWLRDKDAKEYVTVDVWASTHKKSAGQTG